jgi:hypothetical protein
MRRGFIAGALLAALVALGFAVPAGAVVKPTFLEATLVGEGDPDGSGQARLEFGRDKNSAFICHQIQVANVARPITGGAITLAGSDAIEARLIIVGDVGGELEGCTGQLGIKNRDLSRILRDPSNYVLHLYNAEHPCNVTGADQVCPPGAVAGTLQAAP